MGIPLRAGEGAPYIRLKPAGLDEGPVIPVAEQAIESGSPERLIAMLTDTLNEHRKDFRGSAIPSGRDSNS
ncbi:DUF6448 family protein [Tabrizicola sp. BL-A-41-H6]|uniref:DUF6448 family protein n=1 Tax=Tabrizicola sp. BL-A-41-H6 TaxID=3421107 RepID=UPI003D676F79